MLSNVLQSPNPFLQLASAQNLCTGSFMTQVSMLKLVLYLKCIGGCNAVVHIVHMSKQEIAQISYTEVKGLNSNQLFKKNRQP